MEEKNIALLKCWIRVLGAFSAISFLWVAFVATGINNGSTDISAFASRLVTSNLAIAAFSLVYGFSALLFRAKKLSSPAKRSIHILVNYIAAMVCVYALHSNVSGVAPSAWIVVLLFATVIFMVVYGVGALIGYLIKRKN